tara:strand:+ start:657 stop:797 length:141 start_codon:yes stop_codon:yes gene_type:complete
MNIIQIIITIIFSMILLSVFLGNIEDGQGVTIALVVCVVLWALFGD